ncbi:MAG: hypothetical protein KDC89_12930, partial [Flavobacteriaceae bacterium]|nr:hypothetical protein [Flavobacteriaceae bacterium]
VRNGESFWTRPIDVSALPNGEVRVVFIIDGYEHGRAKITEYGRGQLMENEISPHHTAAYGASVWANFDPFLVNGSYGSMASQKVLDWQPAVTLPQASMYDYSRAIGLLIFRKEAAIYCTNVSVNVTNQKGIIHAYAHKFTEPIPLNDGSLSAIFNYETDAQGQPLPGNKPFFMKIESASCEDPDISIVTIQSKVYSFVPKDPPQEFWPISIPSFTRNPTPLSEVLFAINHPFGGPKHYTSCWVPDTAPDAVREIYNALMFIRLGVTFAKEVAEGSSACLDENFVVFDAAGFLLGVNLIWNNEATNALANMVPR